MNLFLRTKAFWNSFGMGFVEMAYDVLRGPVGRWVIVWMATGRVPGMDTAMPKIRACGNLPKSTRTMSTADGLALCAALNLKGPPGYLTLGVERVDHIWNGMGPDCWPMTFREMIDRVCGVVFPCSLPHDLWYSLLFNDGTYETYRRVSDEWHCNSALCVAYYDAKATTWWQRKMNGFSAALAEKALATGGYSAWVSAHGRIKEAGSQTILKRSPAGVGSRRQKTKQEEIHT